MIMDEGVTARICRVIASVVDVPVETVSETTSQDSLEGWDSLAHIHLIMGLEAEFGVSFDVDQAIELTSVAAIYAALVEHAAAPGR